VFPLPPLPVISDPILEKQVFTHQSCFPRKKWRFEDPEEDPSLDYEKLEHVGDSILGMVVTTWLHELKPRLTCGRASVSCLITPLRQVADIQKLKSHLVSNATLSHISGLYNLPSRLVGPPNLLPVLKAQTDVRAAMVEAYIAAIYFSYPVEKRMTEGLKVIDEWLRDMYEPLYDFFLNHM
jgi:dsRNA-specific ribonuclease